MTFSILPNAAGAKRFLKSPPAPLLQRGEFTEALFPGGNSQKPFSQGGIHRRLFPGGEFTEAFSQEKEFTGQKPYIASLKISRQLVFS